jgi:hypothetical protein
MGDCNGKCVYVKWYLGEGGVKLDDKTKPNPISNPSGSTPSQDALTQLKIAASKWLSDNDGWAQKCPKPDGQPAPNKSITTICACSDYQDFTYTQVDPPLPPPGSPQAAIDAAAKGTPTDIEATWVETTKGKSGNADVEFTAHGTMWLIKKEGKGECKPKKVRVTLAMYLQPFGTEIASDSGHKFSQQFVSSVLTALEAEKGNGKG